MKQHSISEELYLCQSGSQWHLFFSV